MIVLALMLGLLQAEPPIALAGARILDGTGRVFDPGTIVIHQGRILSVEEGRRIPEGARVEDLAGRWVIPGLVEAAGTTGVSGPSNEDSAEITPGLRILDAVDPGHPEFRHARERGVTTVFVAPGNRNVIGGLAALFKTGGRVLVPEAALKAALGSGPSAGNFPPRGVPATFFARRPTTRMGVVWEFRKAFEDAREGRGAGGDPLTRVLEGRLPLRIAASEAADVESALDLARELKLNIVIEEAGEAWRRAAELAAAKVPVLLRPALRAGAGEPRLDAFVVLLRAGVTTGLLPADGSDLRITAAMTMKHGASRDEALKAVTLVPAGILGLGARIGSLEAGKDADLAVCSGDPFDPTVSVERVMIDGVWVAGKGKIR